MHPGQWSFNSPGRRCDLHLGQTRSTCINFPDGERRTIIYIVREERDCCKRLPILSDPPEQRRSTHPRVFIVVSVNAVIYFSTDPPTISFSAHVHNENNRLRSFGLPLCIGRRSFATSSFGALCGEPQRSCSIRVCARWQRKGVLLRVVDRRGQGVGGSNPPAPTRIGFSHTARVQK